MSLVLKILVEIIAGLVIGLLLRQFYGVFVRVDGRSMLDTLDHNEILFVRRYSRKRQPQRFDVVICRFPNEKRFFLKRLIALPGETVSMEADIIYINGSELKEDFPKRKCMRKIEETCLGDNEYFLMGDNRPGSKDSRRMGPIGRKAIFGRAVVVLFPWKKHRRIH